MESSVELIERSFNQQYSDWVHEALDELPDSFTITDPCISGHPIVFASPGLLKMLGYSKQEVIGNNGRVFQGPFTNRRAVLEIREAIREERVLQITILNYHKDGTPFWILFHMTPVFSNQDGRVTHFVGVQLPITRKPLPSFARDNLDFCDFLLASSSCRRELCCSKPAFDSAPLSRLDSTIGLEDLCEATELDKQKASDAVDNILSVLSRYSELTGKPVSGKRCNMHGTSALSSALIISLGRINQSFVLYDPDLLNLPFVYVSDAFLAMTGYGRHELLGCSRKLICGLGTDSSTLDLINQSVKGGQTCKARILYYRKDQSSFWNLLYISPVRNASGKIAYFVEVQVEEDDDHEGCKNPHGLSPEQRQLGAIGAVKVAVRTQSIGHPSSKSKA